MSSSRPVIVFVTGSYQTPATYAKFFEALNAEGFEVHAPRLPTSEKPTRFSPSDDVENVRSLVTSLVDQQREIVLTMHSYGGVVGTTAIRDLSFSARKKMGKQGGVIHLLYMCAFILSEDTTMADLLAQVGFSGESILDIAQDGTSFPVDPKEFLYHDVPAENAEEPLRTLVRAPLSCMSEPRMEYAGWRDVPSTYLYTTEDHALPLAFQKLMTGIVKEKGGILQLETYHCGHSPHLVKLHEMVDAVAKVCGI